MRIEKIGEPIRVLADCAGGAVNPVRFRWGKRSYAVAAVNGRWVDRHGEAYSLHYSVQVGDETYYIHFDSGEVQWWLDQVIAE